MGSISDSARKATQQTIWGKFVEWPHAEQCAQADSFLTALWEMGYTVAPIPVGETALALKIAAIIRQVDGNHTIGAAELGERIAAELTQ